MSPFVVSPAIESSDMKTPQQMHAVQILVNRMIKNHKFRAPSTFTASLIRESKDFQEKKLRQKLMLRKYFGQNKGHHQQQYYNELGLVTPA